MSLHQIVPNRVAWAFITSRDCKRGLTQFFSRKFVPAPLPRFPHSPTRHTWGSIKTTPGFEGLVGYQYFSGGTGCKQPVPPNQSRHSAVVTFPANGGRAGRQHNDCRRSVPWHDGNTHVSSKSQRSGWFANKATGLPHLFVPEGSVDMSCRSDRQPDEQAGGTAVGLCKDLSTNPLRRHQECCCP